MPMGSIYYARSGGVVILKMTGEIRVVVEGRYQLSSALNEFLNRLFARCDFQDILIDLTQASIVDSTNLGLLAKITQFTQTRFGRKAVILSSNPDLNQILEAVCFDREFILVKEPQALVGVDFELPGCTQSDLEQTRTVLEAHKSLMALDPRNVEAFKEVVALLEMRVTR